MKRFDTFGAYMFDLLFAPLKKGRKAANQFAIFFRVVGREFDGLKTAIFRVRDEANVASASEVMLPVHGQDRDMPRLEGEDAEAYRTRLSMKGIISEWSGTRQGILYVLAALGYEQSRIEPVYEQDPDHWAEFIIFLKGKKQSGVHNLSVIDAEVRKVKEGSSRPFYGTECGNVILLLSRLERGLADYPRCNQLLCGLWPHVASTGYLLKSVLGIADRAESGDARTPRAGTIAASEEFYHWGEYTLYAGFGSALTAASRQEDGVKLYLRCAEPSRCSPTNDPRGGIGSVIEATLAPMGRAEGQSVDFPRIGSFAASPACFCFGENTIYRGLPSALEAVAQTRRGVMEYMRCSDTARCSNIIQTKGGAR